MSFRADDECITYARLLVVAERLHDAIVSRDAATVRALVDTASASSLPRGVREEALLIVALPRESLRAPLLLLQFHHRMTELLRDDTVDLAQPQLEMPFGRWDSRRSA